MQPQLGKFKKKFPTLTESTIRLWVKQEIQGKFERKEESKQGSCSRDRSNTWQALVVGCLARLEATGDDHIPKNDRGRDKSTCSQGSFNWFIAFLSRKVWQIC